MANENKNADVCLIRGIAGYNQIMPQVAKPVFGDNRWAILLKKGMLLTGQ